MAEDHIPLGPNLSRSPFDRGCSDQQKSLEERGLQESSEQVLDALLKSLFYTSVVGLETGLPLGLGLLLLLLP